MYITNFWMDSSLTPVMPASMPLSQPNLPQNFYSKFQSVPHPHNLSNLSFTLVSILFIALINFRFTTVYNLFKYCIYSLLCVSNLFYGYRAYCLFYASSCSVNTVENINDKLFLYLLCSPSGCSAINSFAKCLYILDILICCAWYISNVFPLVI